MTKVEWKRKNIKLYTGYTIRGNTFGWDSVEYIGEVFIDKNTLQAYFSVHFKSGNKITCKYDEYILDPILDTTRTVGFFKKSHPRADIQTYFNTMPTKLEKLYKRRQEANAAFSRYRVGILRLQGLRDV